MIKRFIHYAFLALFFTNSYSAHLGKTFLSRTPGLVRSAQEAFIKPIVTAKSPNTATTQKAPIAPFQTTQSKPSTAFNTILHGQKRTLWTAPTTPSKKPVFSELRKSHLPAKVVLTEEIENSFKAHHALAEQYERPQLPEPASTDQETEVAFHDHQVQGLQSHSAFSDTVSYDAPGLQDFSSMRDLMHPVEINQPLSSTTSALVPYSAQPTSMTALKKSLRELMPYHAQQKSLQQSYVTPTALLPFATDTSFSVRDSFRNALRTQKLPRNTLLPVNFNYTPQQPPLMLKENIKVSEPVALPQPLKPIEAQRAIPSNEVVAEATPSATESMELAISATPVPSSTSIEALTAVKSAQNIIKQSVNAFKKALVKTTPQVEPSQIKGFFSQAARMAPTALSLVEERYQPIRSIATQRQAQCATALIHPTPDQPHIILDSQIILQNLLPAETVSNTAPIEPERPTSPVNEPTSYAAVTASDDELENDSDADTLSDNDFEYIENPTPAASDDDFEIINTPTPPSSDTDSDDELIMINEQPNVPVAQSAEPAFDNSLNSDSESNNSDTPVASDSDDEDENESDTALETSDAENEPVPSIPFYPPYSYQPIQWGTAPIPAITSPIEPALGPEPEHSHQEPLVPPAQHQRADTPSLQLEPESSFESSSNDSDENDIPVMPSARNPINPNTEISEIPFDSSSHHSDEDDLESNLDSESSEDNSSPESNIDLQVSTSSEESDNDHVANIPHCPIYRPQPKQQIRTVTPESPEFSEDESVNDADYEDSDDNDDEDNNDSEDENDYTLVSLPPTPSRSQSASPLSVDSETGYQSDDGYDNIARIHLSDSEHRYIHCEQPLPVNPPGEPASQPIHPNPQIPSGNSNDINTMTPHHLLVTPATSLVSYRFAFGPHENPLPSAPVAPNAPTRHTIVDLSTTDDDSDAMEFHNSACSRTRKFPVTPAGKPVETKPLSLPTVKTSQIKSGYHSEESVSDESTTSAEQTEESAEESLHTQKLALLATKKIPFFVLLAILLLLQKMIIPF